MNISRRVFVRATVSGAGLAATLPGLLFARSAGAALPPETFFAPSPADAIRAVLGSEQSMPDERVHLDITGMVEVADMVPLSVNADLDDMESVTIVADRNPNPIIAHYRLDTRALHPYVATRVRLAASGDVHALVKAHGTLHRATRNVEISIPGCGDAEAGPEASPGPPAPASSNSIRMRIKESGPSLVVRVLIDHPMNPPGQDAKGEMRYPGDYIQEVTAKVNGHTVLSGDWSAGISRSPYLSFKIRQAAPGNVIRLSWRDNEGNGASRDMKVG